jgi:phosphatidate cytidylyltransferase
MHLKRWISGLIMAPCLILFILFAPPWLFLILILFVTFLGLKEYYTLALPALVPRKKMVGIFLSLLLPLSLYAKDFRCFLAGMAMILMLLFILALFEKGDFSRRVDQIGRHLLGLFYVPFLLGHFILMHKMAEGRLWILFTLVVVYFGDTAAFYVGRTWGRKKLAPEISPGKTVEGGAGAIGGSIAGALFFQFFFLPHFPAHHALVLAIGAGIIGQLGDLFESLLKRSAEVKDSGTLIPGHGGLLDRIDSVLFAGPWVYYYLWGTGLG